MKKKKRINLLKVKKKHRHLFLPKYKWPSESIKLRGMLRRLINQLHQEEELEGKIVDEQGRRFLLGTFYLLTNDLKGATAFYEWYVKVFHGDISDPMNDLTWALVFLRNGYTENATDKLFQVLFENNYLCLRLFGEKLKEKYIFESRSSQWIEWAKAIPEEVFGLWSDKEIEWAKFLYYHPKILEEREEYFNLSHHLKVCKSEDEYSKLLTEQENLKILILNNSKEIQSFSSLIETNLN